MIIVTGSRQQVGRHGAGPVAAILYLTCKIEEERAKTGF